MAPSIITAFHQTVHQHHLAPSDWQWNLLRAPSDLDAVLHDLSHWDWGKAWRDIGGAGALGAVGGTVEIGFKGWPGVKGGASEWEFLFVGKIRLEEGPGIECPLPWH